MVVSPFQQEIHSKTLNGCLKLQVLPTRAHTYMLDHERSACYVPPEFLKREEVGLEFSEVISIFIHEGIRGGTSAQRKVGEGSQHPVFSNIGLSVQLGLGGWNVMGQC